MRRQEFIQSLLVGFGGLVPGRAPASSKVMNHASLFLVATTVFVMHAGATAFAEDRINNIRPRDSAASLLLQFGMERSQTFRDLVRDLDQSKVIVYVHVRRDPDHAVGGFLTFMAEADGWRWLRATIDTGTTDSGAVLRNLFELTGILGHELQHAREVVGAPSMEDLHDFEMHFRRIGMSQGKHSFDTAAAVEVGRVVASDLRSGRRRAASDTACDAGNWSRGI